MPIGLGEATASCSNSPRNFPAIPFESQHCRNQSLFIIFVINDCRRQSDWKVDRSALLGTLNLLLEGFLDDDVSAAVNYALRLCSMDEGRYSMNTLSVYGNTA